jgi:hypothetical protein
LHTIENISNKSNLERINHEFILDLYRSILDKDMESVHKQLVKSCREYLQNSQADLKNDFNIDVTKFNVNTAGSRKQQIDDLFNDDLFKDELYNNFDNFINSIDFTNRDNVNEETLRTISLVTSDEYKPRSFNRLIPVKFSTIFDSSFVENNKTLDEPFYPAYGLYPPKNSNVVFDSLTNSIVNIKLNKHFDLFCINSKHFNTHHLGIKLFKKF